MKKNYFLLIMAFCCLFSVTQKSFGQLSFNSTPVTTATVGVPYTYSAFAADGTSNAPVMTCPTLPSWMSFAANGSTSAVNFGPAITAPAGIAGDTDGNTYVLTNSTNNSFIYKIAPDGTANTSWAAVDNGAVYAMNVDGGYLYVSYYRNNVTGSSCIKKISLTNPGAGQTMVYNAGVQNRLLSLVFRGGFIYSADFGAAQILKIDPTTSTASVYVSTPSPFGLGFNANGLLYIANLNDSSISTFDGATLVVAKSGLSSPSDVKIDSNGNVYVSSRDGGIKKYNASLTTESTLVSTGFTNRIWGMNLAPTGSLIFGLNQQNTCARIGTGAVLSGTPTSANIGTHNVTIRATTATETVDQSFVVTVQGPPTITNFPDLNGTVGTAFTLTDPTSNSAGAFTYTSSNPAVATISGNTVTHVAAGTTTITATQAASGNYTQGTITSVLTVTTCATPVALTKNIIVQLDAAGNATIVASDVDNGSTYECGLASMSLDKTTFSCADIGVNTVVLTVTDNNGNSRTNTATVTVVDITAPVFTSVTQINVNTDADTCGAIVTYVKPIVTDNCAAQSNVLLIWDELNANTTSLQNALIEAGNTVTLSSTSETGYNGANPALTGFDAVVHLNGTTYDTAMPVEGQNALLDFVLNQGKTYVTDEWSAYEADEAGTMDAMREIIVLKRDTGFTEPTTYSQVSSQASHPILAGVPTSFNLPVAGGNTGFARVYSSNQPTVLMTSSQGDAVAVREFSNGGKAIGFQHAGNYSGSTVLSDVNIQKLYSNAVRSGETVQLTQTAGLASGSVFPVGTTTNTFTATDGSGNMSTTSFDVVVTDNQVPVIVSNGDINVNTDAVTCGATVAVSATATDNCTVGLPTGVRSDGFALDALYPVGTTTIAWNVSDANSNAAVAVVQTVVVTDIEKPIAITKNITVQLNAAGTATIAPADVNDGSTDACGISLLELDITSFTCANVGANTVTLKATDVNGNVATQTAIVTVEDKVAPVVFTKNITVQLDALGSATIAPADIDNGSTDNCGISLVELDKLSFTCANIGANTITLKVTDVNGNVATQTAIVTVEDKIAPTAITKNITVQLNAAGNATIVAADVNNESSDACGIATAVLDKTAFTCANVGANTVTLTVTDNNGNASTQTAVVTVEDKIAPIVVTKNVTIQLNAAGTASIVAADIDNGSTDNCGISLVELDKLAFTCANIGANTVTLKVTDANGNVATQTAIVTVEDKIAPIAITKNITVQLNAAGNATIVAADVNNGSSDACGIATAVLDKTAFTCANVGANTVRLTVTDNNGNFATQTAIVTIEDIVAPIVVTKNKTIQLNAAGTASIVVADINNGSTDNCGISLVELDKLAFTCANVGANTVTLKVTDVNGNVATQTATVTVEDKIAPIVITKNITIQLDNSSNRAIVPSDINNGSTDNCGIRSLELDKMQFNCANVGENVVTLKVTDNSGNVSTRTAVVTVVNTQPNLIRKHFDDVIFFDNNSKAFVSYSWYKNGVLVSGQTAQYFKDNGVLNGSYYAIAKKADGTFVTTCPLTFSPSIVDEFLRVAPNPVQSGASFQVVTNVDAAKLQNARVTVFNLLGLLVDEKVMSGTTMDMIAPNTEGIYIVKMTLSNGKYFTKNLLVKN